jgi:Xaa-Pro aminopeptidase/Xaa-Pro dipeptidase
VEVLRAGLEERDLDGALVSWEPHVRYFSGVLSEWTPAFLVVDPVNVIAIVPESAGIVAEPGVELHTYVAGAIEEIVWPRRNALAEIARVNRDRGIAPERLGVEREHVSLVDVDVLPGLVEAIDIGPLITRQRMRKDADEVARIRVNLSVLETGFDAARATIQPGVTELAVWAAMHAAMQAKAGAAFPLQGNFASGPRTLENEPQATNRRIEAGDVVFIDLYPIIDGYAADLTRTLVAGRPTTAQRARHAILKEALAAGVATLKPGARACDVDLAVRSSIAAALGGYTLPHHAGHALGLQGQERPMLIPGDDTVLEAGMVIAIEPGAYLPDTGGMRIEGNYLVLETESEPLSDYPMELFACG